MEPQIYSRLRRFISVVDELRDVGLQQYVKLPRICVVGTQSAGKSSVLEAIVGFNFLPRGDGIVTRRPLELRLVHVPESDSREEPWSVFDLGGGKTHKCTSFVAVKEKIEELTDEVAGKNKGISDDPIVLTVHSKQCPDLTLIDLPGITRVPLKGTDQTDDVERLTRDMAMVYAKDERTIVLAVVPANVDISTSDALQIGRRVDPRGVRTIGVITKIDLMDRGTDAASMLLGEEVPLRLGYTGIKNRSQADIREGKSIEESVQEEQAFFAEHPVYCKLPAHVLGTKSLVEKLTKVLFRHIRSFLPDIKNEINTKIRSVSSRLDELGVGVPVEASDKVQLMWTMITDYCEIFKNTIRGKYDKRLQTYYEGMSDSRGGIVDITGGAYVRNIFYELLGEYVERNITADMTDYDIDLAIRIHEGDSLPGFPSTDTFEYLILPHLRKIHSPITDCLDRVAQALEALSQRIATRVFSRFPVLADRVLELSTDTLSQEKENTRVVLENIVSAETGYLFTNDTPYLTNHGAMISMHDKEKIAGGPPSGNMHAGLHDDGLDEGLPDGTNQSAQMTAERASQMIGSMRQSVAGLWSRDNEKTKTRYSGPFIREIRSRLDAYFNIVLRNVRDSVPKAIGYFLVRQLQDKLQFQLNNQLNKAEHLSALLGEPPQLLEQRKGLTAQLQTLKKALQVLQRDPDITSGALGGFGGDDLDPLPANSASPTSGMGGRHGHHNPSHYNSGQQGVMDDSMKSRGVKSHGSQRKPPTTTATTATTASSSSGLSATGALPYGVSQGGGYHGESSRSNSGSLFGPSTRAATDTRKPLATGGSLFGDKAIPSTTGQGKALFDAKEPVKKTVNRDPLFPA
eukprot:Lankesteria_metandrocarpae@DN2682_c0_g1_i1.p1